ncbi:MAG: YidH family protein [Actinoallomurus sp.]
MLSLWRTRKPALDEVGEDPDYRFSLANERTFLAWIRTSLGLLAGGVGVVQLVPRFSIPGGRTALGVVLVSLALLVSASSYARWERNERAIRMNRALPHSSVARVLALGLSLVAVGALVLIVHGAGHPS